MMKAALELAERVAARLGGLEGVSAVVLGGSWARGAASPDSDIDLGIYYEPDRPFEIADLLVVEAHVGVVLVYVLAGPPEQVLVARGLQVPAALAV